MQKSCGGKGGRSAGGEMSKSTWMTGYRHGIRFAMFNGPNTEVLSITRIRHCSIAADIVTAGAVVLTYQCAIMTAGSRLGNSPQQSHLGQETRVYARRLRWVR